MSKAYLAGPITGSSYLETVEWRVNVAARLAPAGIRCLSPMRDKGHLEDHWSLPRFNEGHVLSAQRAIFTRDHFDVRNCDVVLMNLLHADRISIGSMVELGLAVSYRKPVVLVMEPGNVHDHPFVREAADFLVEDLDTAVTVVTSILAAHREETPA